MIDPKERIFFEIRNGALVFFRDREEVLTVPKDDLPFLILQAAKVLKG
jgi:hypothetical protein